MDPAAKIQFERIATEYATWRAVPEQERSPAPAWWWGPAFEVRGALQSMPAEWCASLGLPDGAAYAHGARIVLGSLADQTSPAWPGAFPRNNGNSNPADASD